MNQAKKDHQNFTKYASKKGLTLQNNEETFQKKFKLTEKIQKLSSSPVYERALSPWTRKRNQSLVKSINFGEQNSSPTHVQTEVPIVSMRQQPNVIHETNISDFLRKIQFTKRKQSVITSKFSPDKNDLNPSHEKSPTRKGSKREPEVRFQEMKQLIIYPKPSSPVKQQDHSFNQSKTKNSKKKQSSDLLIATIQNFYDPFQHKTQQPFQYSIPKGMVKFTLKIQDKLSLNQTAPFTQPSEMTTQMQKTFRKGSVDGKTERNHLIPSETERDSDRQKDLKSNQIVINSTHRTFFKTHKRTFSKKSATEATQENLQFNKNVYHHRNSSADDMSIQVPTQPTYASPTGQAIRRIKLQHKRSRKVKTEVKQKKQNVDSISGPLITKDDKEYLYRTFLNYKTQKNSNGHNITKTLNLTFHNKETFQKNIEKALSLK